MHEHFQLVLWSSFGVSFIGGFTVISSFPGLPLPLLPLLLLYSKVSSFLYCLSNIRGRTGTILTIKAPQEIKMRRFW